MSMCGYMQVEISDGRICLLDRAQGATHKEAIAHRDEVWKRDKFYSQTHADQYNDTRLKCHILGEWLLDS